jgi:hypothetical protein
MYGWFRPLSLARAAVAVALAVSPARAVRALEGQRAVEPPPARYASGPTLYGATRERTFSDPFSLQHYCDFYLGRPPSGYYQACYIPALDEVVLPNERAWPSGAERQALRAHEWAHARGWRHPRLTTASIY